MPIARTPSRPSPFALMWDTRPPPPRVRVQGTVAGAGLLTHAFIMFGFAILSGALAPALRYARGEEQLVPGEADIGNTISQAIILAGVLFYFIRNPRVFTANARALVPYIVICLLCMTSALWSQYPGLTIRRCITLTNCVMFGLLCAEEVGLDGAIRLYGRTTVILMILSILAYVGVPRVGHDVALGYSDAMRGVYAQKNTLGEGAVLAIACSGYVLLNRPRRPMLSILSMLFMFGCIALAKSATSLGIALILIVSVMAVYVSRLRAGPLVLYAMGAGALLVAFIVVFDPDILFKLIQRDASLTGRVPLWQLSIRAIHERPWLGYGYAAFWNESARATQYIWELIDWNAPSAHNGYIDVMLQLGVVGLGVYVSLWGAIIYYAARIAARGDGPEAIWILLYMVVNLLLNMDEGPLPYPDQFTAFMPATLIFIWRWRLSMRGAKMPEVARVRFADRPANRPPASSPHAVP